jgi:hypothetical protein
MPYFVISALLFVGTELGESLGTTGPNSCPGWNIFQGATLQALLIGVDLILALRGMHNLSFSLSCYAANLYPVYALYNHSTKIKHIIMAAFIVENIVMLVTLVRAVPSMRFDAHCIVVSSPVDLIYCAYVFFVFCCLLSHVPALSYLPNCRRLQPD